MTRTIRNRILAIVLLPAFIWLIYNNAANWHLHQLSSGWIVSHAHPFDSSNDTNGTTPGHKHNSAQLLVLDEISNLLTLAIVVIALRILINRANKHYIILAIREKVVTHFTLIPHLRGPPQLCY